MTENIHVNRHIKDYSVVQTKRHKPCLILHGYRYVQDKIQNRTIYWRCDDRIHCKGRARQLMSNGSVPIVTKKHNHQPIAHEPCAHETRIVDGQRRQRRQVQSNMLPYHRNGAGKQDW
jgi:hypothetical protein